jgi:hypothetical protein
MLRYSKLLKMKLFNKQKIKKFANKHKHFPQNVEEAKDLLDIYLNFSVVLAFAALKLFNGILFIPLCIIIIVLGGIIIALYYFFEKPSK